MKRLLLCALVCAPVCANPRQEGLYTYMSNVFLKSAEVHDEQKPSIELHMAATSKKQDKEHGWNVQFHSIAEAKQRVLFAQLLRLAHPDEMLGDVLGEVGVKRLDLLSSGGAKELTLASRLKPQTLFGQVMLTKLLITPESDIAALRDRQTAVRAIAQNKQLRAHITEALESIKSGQELLLSFFDEKNELHEDALKSVYPLAAMQQRSVSYCYGSRAAAAALKVLNFGAVGSIYIGCGTLGLVKPEIAAKPFMPGQSLRQIRAVFNESRAAANIMRVLAAAMVGVGCYATYDLYNQAWLEHRILMTLQARLIGLANIVRGLQIIDTAVAKNPSLARALPELANINRLLEQTPQVKELLTLLATPTFEGEPSYFSRGARILVAFKLAQDHKALFTPAVEAAGLLDALTSAARKVVDPAKSGFCLVEFVDSQEPIIKMDNFWNPLMDFDKAQINSVALGKGGDHNMLITGPNGSGKSTNMKGVVLNAVFAQALGIAAAQRVVMTPVDKINAYLNVQEDLSSGESTFMAEMHELDRIVNEIVSVPTNRRCLTVIDEGLRGTVAAEGIKRLTQALRDVAKVPGNIGIVATHFEEPTALEAETNGAWRNYYVEILESTPGVFKRTFRLLPGVNAKWFKDAEWRNRFINSLMQEPKKVAATA